MQCSQILSNEFFSLKRLACYALAIGQWRPFAACSTALTLPMGPRKAAGMASRVADPVQKGSDPNATKK
jgi:hypothetical protein